MDDTHTFRLYFSSAPSDSAASATCQHLRIETYIEVQCVWLEVCREALIVRDEAQRRADGRQWASRLPGSGGYDEMHLRTVYGQCSVPALAQHLLTARLDRRVQMLSMLRRMMAKGCRALRAFGYFLYYGM